MIFIYLCYTSIHFCRVGMAAPQENGHIPHNQQDIDPLEINAYYRMKEKARQVEFLEGCRDSFITKKK